MRRLRALRLHLHDSQHMVKFGETDKKEFEDRKKDLT